MVQLVHAEAVRSNRKPINSAHGQQWRTDYVGHRTREDHVTDAPYAYLLDIGANGTIPPHFHQVDQFQILVGGRGTIGRSNLQTIALHYVDHHTAYGPLSAGPYGLALFTMRVQSDPGGIYLDDPGYKARLRPSPQRYLQAEGIALSTEPVLQGRREASVEDVFQTPQADDGLGATILRLGGGMRMASTDPKRTGGQYYLTLSGSLEFAGKSYAPWSVVYLTPEDDAFQIQAGPYGLEALALSFPRWKSSDR